MAYVPLAAIQQGIPCGQASTPAKATVNRGNVPDQPVDGDVFYVDSNASAATPNGSFTRPHLTIDAAYNQCAAGNNDIVYVKNKHSETISNATSWVMDTADVQVIGLGYGANRPVITLDTAATAAVPVSAANNLVKNLIFSANFADVSEVFTLSAVSFTLLDCRFQDTAASVNFLDIVDISAVANECDDLVIARCEWISVDTGTGSIVNVDEDIDGLTVMDCLVDLGINGVLSAIFECAAGKDTTNLNIRSNDIRRMVTASAVQLGTWVDTTTQNTGVVADNVMRCVDTDGEIVCTAASNLSYYRNFSSSVAGAGGYLLPVADA